MSLFICSLNSGSNGNCYYIGNKEEAVLIDAGLSCRETERRMKRQQLSMKKVRAIFISHEHGDHIWGAGALSKKYQLPVYITSNTLQEGKANISPHLVITFQADIPVEVGNLSVTAFQKLHDACDPHSFIVESNKVKVGVFTDIGKPCLNVIRYFKQCDAAFLEANYDEAMLDNSGYPLYLKKRIRSDYGHLSNSQALDLFVNHKPKFMTHLFLSHLSANNNSPKIAKDLFDENAGRTKIILASREKETEVYSIRAGIQAFNPPIKHTRTSEYQLSLF